MTNSPSVDVQPAPSALFDLEDRVAIVTGASGGLGAAFGPPPAAAGAPVIVGARRAEPLEKLAAENERIEAIPCDVSDDDGIRSLVADVLKRHGRIDICVNNAGVSSGGPDEQHDP